MAGYSTQNAILFQNYCALYLLLHFSLNNDKFTHCALEIPLNYLFKNIRGKREIDFVFYFYGYPTRYYEVKTEKDGLKGFRAGINSLFDLYTQDNRGIFCLIISIGMSFKVKTIIDTIGGIKGKARILRTKQEDIRNCLKIKNKQFPAYRAFFNRLDFIYEGKFNVDSLELIKDGYSLDAIIKNMLEIPCNRGRFSDWPSTGITKDEVISCLLREISKTCSKKSPCKRKIERKVFLEELTLLLARNKAFGEVGGSFIGQAKISGAQKELLSYYLPAERILAKEVDSTKGLPKA